MRVRICHGVQPVSYTHLDVYKRQVLLRPDTQTERITAWMSIAVEGNQTRAVIATLLGEPGVATLHDTNGRWDLLAELRAANLAELSKVLEVSLIHI